MTTTDFDGLEEYQPPTGDEPLDAVQVAIVNALVPVIAERIRQDLARAEQEREVTTHAG